MGDLIIRWALWTLFLALVLGGEPWEFPQGGEPLVKSVLESAGGLGYDG